MFSRKISLLLVALLSIPAAAFAHGFPQPHQANPTGDANASSVAVVASGSISAATKNGYTSNATNSFADNHSDAGSTATKHGNTVEGSTYADSVGNSGTTSQSVKFGKAIGATGGFGVQAGGASSNFGGHY